VLAALGTSIEAEDEDDAEPVRAMVGALLFVEAVHELKNIRKLLQQAPK
jgi:hypothetical protein